MAPRGKFVLNKRTVRHIAIDDDRLAAAVDEVAEEVAARSGPTATVSTYTTDRHVAGVTVNSSAQARDGVATRAAQSVAADAAARPYLRGGIRSRAQWRYLAMRDQAAFHAAASRTARYSSLPERVSR